MIQEDKVMVHLIFQSDVEVCHGNMMNFKAMTMCLMQIFEIQINT